jgi:hypothetical protein
MSKPKIVDLQKCEDGSYSPKDNKTKAVTKTAHKKSNGYSANGKHKYMMPSGVDEFLSGMDVGLDLVDAVKIRAMRIMGLRD